MYSKYSLTLFTLGCTWISHLVEYIRVYTPCILHVGGLSNTVGAISERKFYTNLSQTGPVLRPG